MRRMLGIVGSLCLIGATTGWAQQPGGEQGGRGGRGGFSMEQMDTNKDGKLTADELGERGARLLERLDTDKDGAISAAEMQAARDTAGRGGAESRPAGGPTAEGDRGGRGGDRGGFGDIQGMMMQRLKERLQATDEEWKVLEPQLQKIMELQGKLRAGGMMSMFGGGRGGDRGGRGGGAPGMPGMVTMPEAEALQTAIDDTATPVEERTAKVTAALTAYREARAKVQADFNAAGEELKKILTPRQEAILVMSGYLE